MRDFPHDCGMVDTYANEHVGPNTVECLSPKSATQAAGNRGTGIGNGPAGSGLGSSVEQVRVPYLHR